MLDRESSEGLYITIIVEETPKNNVPDLSEMKQIFEDKVNEIGKMMPNQHSRDVFIESCKIYDYNLDVKTNIQNLLNVAQNKLEENKAEIQKRRHKLKELQEEEKKIMIQKNKIKQENRARKRYNYLMKLR